MTAGDIDKLYFYDRIADRYDAVMNRYDLERRLAIVFDRFLAVEELTGRLVVDVGCGTGWFSRRAWQAGARVVPVDIGVSMLRQTRLKCPARPVATDACALALASESADVVISSECIEHTLAPLQAVREMVRILRPGGVLVLSVPNRLWHFSATIANALRLRPYEGLENWVGWTELRQTLALHGMAIDTMIGFHLIPPVIPATWPLLRRLDALGDRIGRVMLNIAVRARRR